MQKSAEYEKKLGETRKMPQDTESEALQKKEKAEQLRMRTLLEQARLAQLLTDILESEPRTSIEKFRKTTEKSQVVTNPDLTEAFIESLTATRIKTNILLETLAAESNNDEKAASLFHWLQLDKDPRGIPLEAKGGLYLDDSYPLALILYVENERDFKLIDTRKNIGGFYKSSFKFYTEDQLRRGWKIENSAPVIVIKGTKKAAAHSTRLHEIRHAEDQTFIKALRRPLETKEEANPEEEVSISHFPLIWTNYALHSSETPADIWNLYKETVKGLIENLPEQKRKILRIARDRSWQKIIHYALDRAKREILAGLRADSNLGHYENLMVKGGVYDYFLEHIGIPETSTFYNQAWDEYLLILSENVRAIRLLIEKYKDMPFMSQRIKILPWVLAQVPIEEWKNQFEGTREAPYQSVFMKEIYRMQELYTMYKKIIKKVPHNKEAERAQDSGIQAYREFQNQVLKLAPYESLYPYIETCEKKLKTAIQLL